MLDSNKKYGFSTKAVHGGNQKNPFGALTTPIYQTSTFIFDSAEQGGRRFALEEEGYIYSRLGNPTCTVLEDKVALLEGAEAGLATASGMGATSSIIWTFLSAGDHLLADKMLYGCTFAYFSHGLTRFGVEVDFIDASDLEQVKNGIKSNTKMLYLETPANPNLKIVDLEAVATIAHDKNKDIKVVVDNTFATPYLQRPIELGCDIVLHSATKYLNGHGDVIAGIILGTKKDIDNIRFVGLKDLTGAVLSPMDAYLIIRGIKTLEVRMERHCSNADKVANFLNANSKIEKVYYPGLPNHEGHDIAKKQMKDFGGTMAFELKGGYDAGIKLLNSLEVCSLAVSLGGTETLIQHPASMTHSPYTEEERLLAGVTNGLIRFSVGIESVEDIIADLEKSLDKL